jgi:2-polyprenyl-6-methoxyphenol hydroxylase-like FAD-dependent oxidoreductase
MEGSLADYDAVVVGASLAGCTVAILLGRAGARVALVEKQPGMDAFKRMCSHAIQSPAVATLERLDLLDPIMAAGAVRGRLRARTRWGWIVAPPERSVPALSLRRQLLDPILREAAAATPGVDLLLDRAAVGVLHDGDAAARVLARDRDGRDTRLRAPLVVGADGRDSRLAELAGVPTRTRPHGRFVYAAYFEGVAPVGTPDFTFWLMDPQCAGALPTDSGLVLYAALPTKDRLPEFRADPQAAMISFLAGLPDPPPIRSGRQVGPTLGKLDLTNRIRGPVAPGLALVGDAALATDPLFGVGCGWALQSGEWLADSMTPALRGLEPLQVGLDRYRRRHRRELRGHAFFIHDYSNGRRMRLGERATLAAATRDPKVAATFEAFATRRIKATRMFAETVPRALAVNARHLMRQRGRGRAD